MRRKLLDVPLERLAEELAGKPKYRARQVWDAVLRGGARDASEVRGWPAAERETLAAAFALRTASVAREDRSTDGTVKWLIDLPRGPSAVAAAAAGVIAAGSARGPARVGLGLGAGEKAGSDAVGRESAIGPPPAPAPSVADLPVKSEGGGLSVVAGAAGSPNHPASSAPSAGAPSAAPSSSEARPRPPLRVETVYIPESGVGGGFAGGRRKRRGTLCVSSQAGCSLACAFCHTGTQALMGGCSAGDILEQVLTSRDRLRAMMMPAASSAAHSPPSGPARSSSPGSGGGSNNWSDTHPISHVVFMGQGEPLLNWANVRGAIRTLTAPSTSSSSSSSTTSASSSVSGGLGMAPRRITISTAGVAPVIPRVAVDTPGVRLALSLHAPTDELRSRIMGINKTYPLEQVLKSCAEFVRLRLEHLSKQSSSPPLHAGRGGGAGAAHLDYYDDHDDDDEEEEDEGEGEGEGGGSLDDTHNGARRVRVTFEYVLLGGVNDSRAHARQLVDLLLSSSPPASSGAPSPSRPRPRAGWSGPTSAPLFPKAARHAHINLIPFNPWPGSSFAASDPQAVEDFRATVEGMGGGLKVTVRRPRGQDILGACGQLRSAGAALKQKKGLPASSFVEGRGAGQ